MNLLPDESNVRYFEMDMDEKLVTEYERAGDCNGCGACCTAVITFQVSGTITADLKIWDARNGGNAPGTEGKWQGVLVNGKYRFWRMTDVNYDNPNGKCSMLSDSNRCKIHIGKSLLSRQWPMSPSQVDPFPECSYSFQVKQQWTLSEWYGKDIYAPA